MPHPTLPSRGRDANGDTPCNSLSQTAPEPPIRTSRRKHSPGINPVSSRRVVERQTSCSYRKVLFIISVSYWTPWDCPTSVTRFRKLSICQDRSTVCWGYGATVPERSRGCSGGSRLAYACVCCNCNSCQEPAKDPPEYGGVSEGRQVLRKGIWGASAPQQREMVWGAAAPYRGGRKLTGNEKL